MQAAFVDFGGNRHGFLAFSEIHPDYYQIPVEDRQALLKEQEELELEAGSREHLEDIDGDVGDENDEADADVEIVKMPLRRPIPKRMLTIRPKRNGHHDKKKQTDISDDVETLAAESTEKKLKKQQIWPRPVARGFGAIKSKKLSSAAKFCLFKWLKRSVVTKALHLQHIFLSGSLLCTNAQLLAGWRYFPKNHRIKRAPKASRYLNSLDMPEGMGVIIRTAGLERSKAEIKRDFEYLIRAWDEVGRQR